MSVRRHAPWWCALAVAVAPSLVDGAAVASDRCPPLATWSATAGDATSVERIVDASGVRFVDAGDRAFDLRLTSPDFDLPRDGLRIAFAQQLRVSWANTNGVLEIAHAGGEWVDFVAAGGRFTRGGYNVQSYAGNPLGSRPAWGGNRQDLQTEAELPASAASGPIRLRFRLGSAGTGDAQPGWAISTLACR